MSEPKFTGGDWRIFHAEGQVCVGSSESQPDTVEDLMQGKCMLIRINGTDAESNGHLVAQVPKMYAALEELLDQVMHDTELINIYREDDGMSPYTEPACVEKVRRILAQARGGK